MTEPLNPKIAEARRKHMKGIGRVAITAYACRATAGSEPGVGYAWTRAASNVAEIQLVTTRLDQDTRLSLVELGVQVNEISVPHLSRAPQISYAAWLLLAGVKLRRLHAEKPFVLTHHVTYAADWLPSPTIKGVPHIWGPVGGTPSIPRHLLRIYPWTVHLKTMAKRVIETVVGSAMNTWTQKHVSLLLAQSNDTALRYAAHPGVVVRPNCVVPDAGNLYAESDDQMPVGQHASVVGRLIEKKGGALALKTFADDRLAHWTLHFYGDGPERAALEALAIDLDMAGRVHFHGKVPRNTALRELASMTCLVHIGVNEGAPWAVAEALAAGVPVVTWSHGGPADMVVATGNGIVVEPGKDPLENLRNGILQVVLLPSRQPSDRFSEEALERDMRSWYCDLVG